MYMIAGGMAEGVKADIDRVCELWEMCREQ